MEDFWCIVGSIDFMPGLRKSLREFLHYFIYHHIFENLMKLAKALVLITFLLLVAVSMSFATTYTITFGGTSFSPSSLNVNTGDTIVWSGPWSYHAIQSTTIPNSAAAWGPTDGNTTSLTYVVTVAGTYNYQCNIHYLMGMTGSFTATTAASTTKAIQLSTTAIDFGSKRVGGSVTKTMTVTSKGPDASLTISSSPLSNGTYYTTSPTTTNRVIAVNSTETETLKFSPTARGTFYDTLTINSNATTVADQVKQIFLNGTGINGVFSGATSLSFDKVRVGNSKQLTYTITNTGDDTLFLSAPAISGTGFSVVTGSAQNIPPGLTGSITLKFSPTIKQVYTGSFNFTAQNSVSVPTITIGGTGTAPIISLAPAANYDMGIAFVGGGLSGSQQVTNTGDDTLHVTNVSLTQQGAKFTLTSATSFTVLPGASTNITFSYISQTESTDNATLAITSDDPGATSKQIAISARSGLPKMSLDTKDTIIFGNARLGGSANAFLTITNLGTYDLTFHVGNFAPDVFSLGSAPSSIPSQGNAQATFVFTPTAEGIVTGMAIVTSNDDKNKNDTIYFKGVGIKSSLDFPSSIDFHDVNINKTSDSVLLLKNFGTGSAKIFSYKLDDPNNGFVLVDTSIHTIGAKDSISVKVRFAPTLEQTYGATLSIASDDGAGSVRQISLAGRGINSKLSTAPSALDFGTLDTGATLSKTFTITNNGTASATITSMKTTGDPSYGLGSVELPLQIASGAKKDISVSFTPKTAGTFDGTVAITATEGSPITVTLHGKGKITITGSVAGANTDMGIKMQIYPNPNNGTATIGLTCSKQLNLQLALYDATGKFIHSYDQTSFGAGEYTLPLKAESLSSGEYYLRAVSGGTVAVEMKVVIVR